jgi:hypothetical protein
MILGAPPKEFRTWCTAAMCMQHLATFPGLRVRCGVCPLMTRRSDAARGRRNARILCEICRRRPAYAGACQRFLRDGRSTKISAADIITYSTDLTCLSELCQIGCNPTFLPPHYSALSDQFTSACPVYRRLTSGAINSRYASALAGTPHLLDDVRAERVQIAGSGRSRA